MTDAEYFDALPPRGVCVSNGPCLMCFLWVEELYPEVLHGGVQPNYNAEPTTDDETW